MHSVVDGRSMTEIIRSKLHRYFGGMESEIPASSKEDNTEVSSKYSRNTVLDNLFVDAWILDSGASTHICNDSSLLDEVKTSVPNTYIHLADGTKHTIKCTTKLTLSDKISLDIGT